MNLKLVEPLRELFKDEVRALGRELGLPDHFVGRHPFPGPGLAIRIPGAVSKGKADILRKADAIYLDEIRKAGLYDEIWQAFAVLLPVRTVGVMPSARDAIVPPARQRYLAEIASEVRGYHDRAQQQSWIAREIQQLRRSQEMLEADGASGADLDNLIQSREERLDTRARNLLENWPKVKESYAGDEYVVKIRDREIRTKLTRKTLSGTEIRKVVLPRYEDHGELLNWMLRENLPGSFPYTAGVFAFKREGEDPTRMAAMAAVAPASDELARRKAVRDFVTVISLF